MGIKKLVILVLSLLVSAGLYAEDWQHNLQGMLENKEFASAREFVFEQFKELDELYHPLLCQVSSYCSHRLDDRMDELEWMATCFEAYPWGDAITVPVRDFLDPELTPFVLAWKEKYPLVRGISFTQRKNPYEDILPSKLVMEITLDSHAFFKLLKENIVVEAGKFQKGDNQISLKTDSLFRGTGSHDFTLELKSDNIIVRKKVLIDIVMDLLQPEDDPVEETVERGYRLSLYYRDQLLASREKTDYSFLSDKIELPPSTYEPSRFDALGRSDPQANSFSILSAIGLAAHLIKGLVQKKDGGILKNPLQRVRSMTIPFRTKNLLGEEWSSQAVVILKTDHISPRLVPVFVKEN